MKTQKKSTQPKNDIDFTPPSIPQELIKDNILKPDEISDIENILNLKAVDSTKCSNLIEKLIRYYSNKNTANPFLFYLTYGIISFLKEMKDEKKKKDYLDTYKKLIGRTDVQIIIFTKADILYKFYTIIFNLLNCIEFVNAFNYVLRHLDESIRPNKEIFWKKFYNFLNKNINTNTKTKLPKTQPSEFESTFVGKEYLDNASEKLLFFSLIGMKSFALPKDYAYFYELIFSCIVNFQPDFSFYPFLMKADPIQSVNFLILYIYQHVAPEHYSKLDIKKKILYDSSFYLNIFDIIQVISHDSDYPVEEYLYQLVKMCIPLISNDKIFIENASDFDTSIVHLIKQLYEDDKVKFFCCLFGFPQEDLTKERYELDRSLCPPIEKSISFFKGSLIYSSTALRFISKLLEIINKIQLDRLQLIIEAYLEMFPNDKENFLSLFNKLQGKKSWFHKYKKAIKDKKNEKAGQDLDKYIKSLQEQTPISPEKEIQLPITIEINNSENSVTYNLIFIEKSSKGVKNQTVTFDGSVTIGQAIRRIAHIGIYGNDITEDEGAKQEPKNENADNDSVEVIDLDDDYNDSYYHSMKLGRDSHFCKAGGLFGHRRTPADRSSREPAEIFGLSNYTNRSISFNSISFPNNTLYIKLVPISKLHLDSSYITKNLKKIQLKTNVEMEQPEVISDNIVLPEIDNDKNVFDLLTSNDMNIIYHLVGHPPTLKDAHQFLKFGKDIKKFQESL